MSPAITGPSTRGLQVLAIPAVCLLVLFLGYASQWVFNNSPNLAPGPLTTRDTITFNSLLLCLWWTYYKACTVDPGRYHLLPTASGPSDPSDPTSTYSPESPGPSATTAHQAQPRRWCKKCRQPKPPRAHHCRHCGRCIPKMDHHCPWTGNCVSLQTFPHFLRFLVFTNLSLWALARLLFRRCAVVWSSRLLPAYLGPTVGELAALAALVLLCAATMLALGILLYTTARGWVLNETMIEGWEMERHEAVLDRRDRYGDDYYHAASGVVPERVEFPYDIGFFANMAQAMGTRNVLMWLLPLAGGPRVSPSGVGVGWEWEENGLNAAEGMWPPTDPDKARRAVVGWPAAAMGVAGADPGLLDYASPEEAKAAFRRRQEEDLWRRGPRRSGIVTELEEDEEDLYDVEDDGGGCDDFEEGMDGQPGWMNADGDRLRDYGVDEEVEEEDLVPPDLDEDVPIAELLRRRKVLTRQSDE